MDRYYLTQLEDGTWQLTHQVEESTLVAQKTGMMAEIPVAVEEPTPPPPVLVDDFVQGTYDTWQEALAAQVDGAIFYDPTPDWPAELGGES